MSKITQHQAAQLHKAIDRARNPGHCSYLGDDGYTPQCVIGQLAMLEGCGVERLRAWDAYPTGTQIFNIYRDREGCGEPHFPFVGPLESYPVDLLEALQEAWDHGGDPPDAPVHPTPPSEAERRDTMRRIVAAARDRSPDPVIEAFREGRIDARLVTRGETATRVPEEGAPESVRTAYRRGWENFRVSTVQLIADIEKARGEGTADLRDPGPCPI